MISIDSAFDPSTLSVHNFYQQPGIGYYIPLYQREYTWDEDNIEQLTQDISKGIENCLEDDDEIRFLGTIILVQEGNVTQNIKPQDPRGLPSRIDKVIDGQQRLSTIALFATVLHDHLSEMDKKLPENNPLSDKLKEASKDWKDKLVELFSLNLNRGTPKRKPKLIRGSIDQWVMDGEIEDNYVSPVAKHLAEYISYVILNGGKPKLDLSTKVGSNLKLINKWIKQDVINAHVNNSDNFLPAWDILQKLEEKYIWQYEKPELVELVEKKENKDKKSLEFLTCSYVQIFSVCHYLLDRSCFTIIKPSKDDWAFDLFQSLNATGTPLTAIETFLPLVVNTTEKEEGNYINSKTKRNFESIENLFSDSKTAAQKNKQTNEFLTSLAITCDGTKLSSHFSYQRKWLNNRYNQSVSYNEQKDLIKFYGNYARYYKDIWIDYSATNDQLIEKIASSKEAKLISLLVLFLKSSNHKMSITILGRFYNDLLNGQSESIQNFIEATKLVASFYIIWRSVKSNSGLDTVYRDFLKGNEKKKIEGHNWVNKKSISLSDLRTYLQNEISLIGVKDFDSWKNLALEYLKYTTSSVVCRIILLMAFHETIGDDKEPGLMKKGARGTKEYLIHSSWTSKDLKTIEHIAPQSENSEWEENFYDENKINQTIGNLTLLPVDINSSAGRKGWKEKFIYYKHLSEKDPQKLQELKNKAKTDGIDLNEETLKILKNASFNEHMLPLVNVKDEFEWNTDFVNKRSERILSIAWDRFNSWLF